MLTQSVKRHEESSVSPTEYHQADRGITLPGFSILQGAGEVDVAESGTPDLKEIIQVLPGLQNTGPAPHSLLGSGRVHGSPAKQSTCVLWVRRRRFPVSLAKS